MAKGQKMTFRQVSSLGKILTNCFLNRWEESIIRKGKGAQLSTEIRALIPLCFLLMVPMSNRLRDAIFCQQLFKVFMQ